MDNENCDKLIFAILQNDSCKEVVSELNKNGFFVTVLQSSGGFLKKSMATLMIGLEHTQVDRALNILKTFGNRTVNHWVPAISLGAPATALGIPPVSVPVHVGGITIFVVNIESCAR